MSLSAMAMGTTYRGRTTHKQVNERINSVLSDADPISPSIAPAVEHTESPFAGISNSPVTTDTRLLNQLDHLSMRPHSSKMSSKLVVADQVASPYRGPQSNMTFNPQPTQSSKCSKLKLKLVLDQTMFIAGEQLQGQLEVTSLSRNNLRLGEISVEIRGREEVTESSTSTHAFLSSRIVLQGERLPLTDAIRGTCKEGYWQANKGKTVFPFAFDLPTNLPGSYTFQSIASLKYTLTAIVQYELRGKRDTLIKSTDTIVIAKVSSSELENTQDQNGKSLMSAESTQKLKGFFNNDDGQIKLEAAVESLFIHAGSDVFVDVGIENYSNRKVQGFKLSLIRKLVFNLHAGNILENEEAKEISETVVEVHFRDKAFSFDPNEKRSSRVHLHIPSTVCTIKNTTIADIMCFIVVSLETSSFFKQEICVNIPVSIYHKMSASENHTSLHRIQSKNRATSPFARNRSAFSMSPSQSPTSMLSRSPSPTSPRIESILPWKSLGNASHVRSLSPPPSAFRGRATNGGTPQTRVLPWSDDEDNAELSGRAESTMFGHRFFSSSKHKIQKSTLQVQIPKLAPTTLKSTVPTLQQSLQTVPKLPPKHSEHLHAQSNCNSEIQPMVSVSKQKIAQSMSPVTTKQIPPPHTPSVSVQQATPRSTKIDPIHTSPENGVPKSHPSRAQSPRPFRPLPLLPSVPVLTPLINLDNTNVASTSMLSVLYNGIMGVRDAFTVPVEIPHEHSLHPTAVSAPKVNPNSLASTTSRTPLSTPALSSTVNTSHKFENTAQRSLSPNSKFLYRQGKPLPHPEKHPRNPPALSDLDVQWNDSRVDLLCQLAEVQSVDTYPSPPSDTTKKCLSYQDFVDDLQAGELFEFKSWPVF
ncbi:hypothetical protein BATDEDRAFT_28810 [Batrachochytrium dendrobatidis JAM81]|uniref:Arrestin C-terminal-like domain-containing protein n=2 Tax=Batrachochytrium dendrobatidis TaxID=109871 RepID=F4PF80_BATDJ|nr:uncharacterized protein BATDEDRAFT_28810 [Batrachochytrium dendrobatidis JAM81]EGF76110.1 hypothetical protein BATDEDRAFT_28810 [Batrachochytrium dendrobatidis JAM81]OAJ42820.1 hypothetical protein, variant [Batrachochytrium dendrobatidis JEL423]|eukprot:XP_006683263.1 hypothetical protein BATDEDRAFT_28810 [Batrachochytrium dendrobatidis JAM81]